MSNWQRIGALAGVLVSAGALAACGSGGSDRKSTSGSGSKSTIVVGNISTLTGANVLPDSVAGAKAYFDYVNAHGGINGHKVKFIRTDDQGNAQNAAQSASRLINEDKVVAMVANESILECSVNAQLYTSSNVLNVADQGVDPACFVTPNIGPVNTGPFTALGVNLTYAVKQLHAKKVCALIPNLPGLQAGDKKVIAAWSQATGQKLALSIQNLGVTQNPTSALLRAKSTGCEAVVSEGPAPYLAAFIKAAAAQKLTSSMKFLFPTTAYDPAYLKAAGAAADGTIINSEFLPYTSGDDALKEPTQILKAANVPLGSQHLGGYLGAKIFADVVSKIDGDVTKESVADAFRKMEPYSTPLMGDPYIFGPGKTHNPNQSSKFIQVKDGKFTEIGSDWFRLGN